MDKKGNICEATLNIALFRDGRNILYDISGQKILLRTPKNAADLLGFWSENIAYNHFFVAEVTSQCTANMRGWWICYAASQAE